MARRHHPSTSGAAHPVRTKTALAVQSALLIGIFAGVITLPESSAYAQTTSQAAQQQYNIGAGSLGGVLNNFASAAGIELSVDAALTQNKVSQGLRGSYTVAEGFAALLQGQNLQVVRSTNGAYSLRTVTANSSETTLPDVVVMAGATSGSATEGTGSYTAAGPSNTATGLALSLRETPQSITVMTRERMDDFKLENLTDVLEQTPGVTVDRQGDGNNFSIRGEAVNLQVDGMRQMASGWYGNNQMLYTMDDMVEIDRIEVLKGSSGLMSGDGKYGGTVNMIRKRPTHEFKASVGAGVGSWDSYRADVDLGGSLNASGTVRGRLVAAAADSKDYKDHVKRNNQTLFGTVDIDLTADTLLNVNFTHRRREYYGAASSSMIQSHTNAGRFMGWQPRSFNPGAPWSGFDQNTNALSGTLEHKFTNGWTAKLRASTERTETPYGELGAWITGEPELLDIAWMRNHVNRNTSFALDVRGDFELLGRKHELMVGADYMRTHSDTTLGSPTTPNLGLDYSQGGAAIPRPDGLENAPVFNPSIFSSKRTSVYAAARLNVTDAVKVIAGTRITDYEQFDLTRWSYSNNDFKKNNVVTPYAGVVVDVHKNVSVYGSYASVFKPQSAIDASGKTLAPEEGQTYEMGAKGEFFDKRLNVSVAHFWMKTDNVAQDTGADMPDGTSIYRAVSGVTKRGYELELSGELSKGWQAQGSYVMNNSDISNTYLPKKQFKLGSTYNLSGALNGLTVGAATRWQSKITAGPLVQPSYWVVDLMARYRVNQKLSLSFNVRNAFDKSYFAGIRTGVRTQYSWGAPRSLNLAMRYDF
jgi:outer membrane receptor for ferric coprogen and ferric-rhodotorulic acid